MVELVSAGIITGVTSAVVVLVRALLQVLIVVWSLRADPAGREFALRLLDALRFRLPPRGPRQ